MHVEKRSRVFFFCCMPGCRVRNRCPNEGVEHRPQHIPTIDKPTRVHGNSATLIDNIFVNNIKGTVSSGNIVSDISDHFSQFCIFHSFGGKTLLQEKQIRDYSHFSSTAFISDLSQISWDSLDMCNQDNVDHLFSNLYNSLNKVINKHAPLKWISKRQVKQFSKPWIKKGLRKSIKIKNSLFQSGDFGTYNIYRNRILTLS